MDHVFWQQLSGHEAHVCCLLSRLIPGAHVVKGFNTLSAWALQNGPSDSNRQVLNMSIWMYSLAFLTCNSFCNVYVANFGFAIFLIPLQTTSVWQFLWCVHWVLTNKIKIIVSFTQECSSLQIILTHFEVFIKPNPSKRSQIRGVSLMSSLWMPSLMYPWIN